MATTKRKTKKAKSTKKKKAAGTRRITFRCSSGGCTATPPTLHVYPGDTVVMKAVGTDVTVRFLASSPFQKKVFRIKAGKEARAKVVKKKPAEFRYRLSCAGCVTPALPPRIIID